MLEEEKTFCKNLYSARNVDPNNSEFDTFINNNLLKLKRINPRNVKVC